MGNICSLSSRTVFTASSSFNSPISRPQLPTVGFITTGYPNFLMPSREELVLKAHIAVGVCIPFF
jgi:hypothetical protein